MPELSYSVPALVKCWASCSMPNVNANMTNKNFHCFVFQCPVAIVQTWAKNGTATLPVKSWMAFMTPIFKKKVWMQQSFET